MGDGEMEIVGITGNLIKLEEDLVFILKKRRVKKMTEIAKAMLDRMRELTEHPEAKVLRATYDAWERGDVPETTLLTREVLYCFKF